MAFTTALVSGLVGALLAVWIRARLDLRADQLALKRDVLRRFVGNSFRLVDDHNVPGDTGEPFVAMHESFVVFADDQLVREALLRIWGGRADGDSIRTLMIEMANAAHVDPTALKEFSPIGRRDRHTDAMAGAHQNPTAAATGGAATEDDQAAKAP